MLAIFTTGHFKGTFVVAVAFGPGTKAKILNMLANEPTVANPPRVKTSFRKFLLLPSGSVVSFLIPSLSPGSIFLHTVTEFSPKPILAINKSPAASPIRTKTKVATAAVGRSKAMLIDAEVVVDEVCVVLPVVVTP